MAADGRGAVLFGGRDEALAEFDQWLDDDRAPPRFVLAAPAGRGKSALLVRWVQRLRDAGRIKSDSGGWRLVFVPISARFGSNRPAVFYQALAAQLADAIGSRLDAYMEAEPADRYKERCGELVEEAVERGSRLLLVIDGADEALGEKFGAMWFSRVPGPRVRILVSARLQLGDRGARDWVQRLDWADVETVAYDLPPLERRGVRALLSTVPELSDIAASQSGVPERLLELTGGEPLLLTYYIEDLLKRGDVVARLTPDDLTRLKPGFGPYFRSQLEELRKAGAATDREVLDAFLAVLACAYGPLAAGELADLAVRAHQIPRPGRVAGVLHPFRRFVIGSGRREKGAGDAGYVLSHPKLGEFLREKYFDDPNLITQARSAFVAWGGKILAGLERLVSQAGEGVPVSPYLLQYLSQHLEDDGQAPESFMRLVSEGWLRAWEAFEEGGHRGFLQDVANVRRAVVSKRGVGQPFWAWQLRCQLVQSSIASFGRRIPAELIVECARTGVDQSSLLRPRRALEWLDHQHGADAVWARAVVAHLLPEAERADVLLGAMRAAGGISDAEGRGRALADLVPYLTEDLLEEALYLAGRIVKSAPRALALVALARNLPEVHWGQLLRMVKETSGVLSRAWALAEIAPFLPEALVGEAVRVAERIIVDRPRVEALAGLAPRLSEAARAELVEGALRFVDENISNSSARALALVALAPHLSAALATRAWEVAGTIEYAWDRVAALVAIVPMLPVGQRDGALREALALVDTLENQFRAAPLTKLVPLLPEAAVADVADQVRQALKHGLCGTTERARGLLCLALATPERHRPDLLSEALLSLKERTVDEMLVEDHREGDAERADALADLVSHLPEDQLSAALQVAEAIKTPEARARAVAGVARHLPEAKRRVALERCLRTMRWIGDERSRFLALRDLLEHLPEVERAGVANEAKDAAERVDDGVDRIQAVASLAHYLTDDERVRLIKQAREIAAQIQLTDDINSARDQVSLLVTAAGMASDAERASLLADARRIGNGIYEYEDRARALLEGARIASPERDGLLSDVLEIVANTRADEYGIDERARYHIFTDLFFLVPSSMLSELRQVANKFDSDVHRALALFLLARRLSEDSRREVVAEAFAAAGRVTTPFSALSRLLPYLDGAERDRVLANAEHTAETITSALDRVYALTSVIPHLPPAKAREFTADAHRTASSVKRSLERVQAFNSIARSSGGTERDTALIESLRSAGQIESDEDLVEALVDFVEILDTVENAPDHIVEEFFRLFASRASVMHRSMLLEFLPNCYSLLSRVEGELGLLEVRRAISDTAYWFP